MKRQNKPIHVPLNDNQCDIVRTIIANLTMTDQDVDRGIKSHVPEQGKFPLQPEMLPSDMKFEREVLRIINGMYEYGGDAIPDQILTGMALGDKRFPDAEQNMARLLTYRKKGGVESLTFLLADWIEQQRMKMAAQAILDRTNLPKGTALDAYREGLQIWSEVAPDDSSITEATDLDMVYDRWLDAGYEKRKSGRASGPTFPWAGLNKKVANLKKGEMCTIMAKSKHGKSTLALLLAEHMAHDPTQKDDAKADCYDVAVFHVETSIQSLADRWFSRKLRVQTGAMRALEVYDPRKNEEQAKKLSDAKLAWAHNNRERGRIKFIGCAGIGITALSNLIAVQKGEAEARGRDLVVIIDYFGEIDFSELSPDEYIGQNRGASRLKTIAESQGVYMIVFAQYGVDSDYSSKKAAFGGQKLIHRSQVVIRVERPDARDNQFVPDNNGQQVKDLLGVPMFYHEIGQPSSLAWLNVTLANDDASGPVPVRFINAYFSCLDDSTNKTRDYRKEMGLDK